MMYCTALYCSIAKSFLLFYKKTFRNTMIERTKEKLAFLLSLLFVCSLSANNISVTNVRTTANDGTNDFTMVEFDLSWDNSWRTSSGPSNWDAAWVFVKFQVGYKDPELTNVSSSGTTITVSSTANLRVGMPVMVTSGTGDFAANTVISSITNGTQFEVSATPTTTLSNASIICSRIWEHATLNTTAGNHTFPPGCTLEVPSDGVGVFLYRSADGSGTFSVNDVQLRWEYGTDGVADNAQVQIKVFAIELVYVPQGSFAAGSGGTENLAFTLTTINTANATTAPSGTGSLGGQGGGYPTGQTAPDNVSWPNGYNAFFCMKYEISQGQYRDFLNTLTRSQQANRVTMDGTLGRYAGGFTWNGSSWSGSEVSNLSTPANRNGLRLVIDPGGILPRTYACDLSPSATLPTGVNQSDDGEWIAMSQLNWMDGCAYTDWAGLRPMTELEYEKACRGNQAPVANEYAWGSTSITQATSISNGGTNNETSAAGANSAVNNSGGIQGPLRVGVFAGGATTRDNAGATYYGLMEMSGDLWERTVTIGNTDGRSFTGVHGNGSLGANGHANATNWPGLNGSEVTGASGSGFRSGDWLSAASYARVSDRTFAASPRTPRYSSYGFRGVRVSP
jgi:formylglycine-generating enzyme required for sulfatase activity